MAVEGTFIAEQKGAACRGRGRPPRPEDNVEKEWKGMEKLTEQNQMCIRDRAYEERRAQRALSDDVSGIPGHCDR